MPLNFVAKAGVTAALMAANMALTMTKKTEGPRLDDLKFTGGDYGAPLPMVWGLRRMECSIFWAEDLKEVKRRRKTKGGKFNEYTYFGTWAVALAGHEIDAVRRIWFDTHLVYDMSGAGPVTPFDFGGVGNIEDYITVYLGTETQLPDPRMEATVEAEFGEGSCPAYRGAAYIVFKDVPLEKIGNRIPQVSVEMASGEVFSTSTMDVPTAASSIALSRDGSLAVFQDTASDAGYLVDIAARTILGTYTLTGTDESGALRDDGAFLIADSSDDSIYAYQLGNPTGTLIHDKAVYFPTRDVWVLTDENGDEKWGAAVGDSKFVFSGAELDADDLAGVDAATAGFFNGPDGAVWLLAWHSASGQVFFIRLGDASEVVTATGFPASSDEPFAAYYEQSDHFVLQYDGGFYTIDRTGAVTNTETSPAYPAAPNRAPWYNLRPGASSIWLGFYEVSLADLSVIRSFDPDQWGVSGDPDLPVIYEPLSHALLNWNVDPVRWFYLDRVGTDGVLLSDIASDVADWCGVEDYDFSDLDQTVTGWSATRGPASNMLEPLLDAYDSDIRPHDFSIEGLKRTGVTSGATLATAWFTGDPRYSVKVRQAAELPRALLVDFADMDADQQPNTARVERPLDATGAVGEQKIDLTTLVLGPTEARQLAGRYFRRVWNERKEVSTALTAQELALEPGDVRTLELDGEEMAARCVRVTIQADGVVGTEWRYDHPSLATLESTEGATFDGRNESVVVIPLLTKGFVLDIPLLSDSDNSINPVLYVAGAPFAEGTWPGATLYQSDGTEYSEELAGVVSSDRATWGYATEVLASADPWIWDETNSVNIRLQTGELSGTTQAAIDLNPRSNQALLGQEIINFASATLEVDGTYTLADIKRGMRGTEWAIDSHTASDLFVLLDTAEPVDMGLSEIGETLSFKAVTAGRSMAGAMPIDLEFTGASLKPYAPVELDGVLTAGDWGLTWTRRSRLGGEWPDVTTFPLAEATEEYEVEILDGATVVRTATVASPAFTYTAAMQSADFAGAQTTVDFRVFQISAAVGRGYPATATVTGGGTPTPAPTLEMIDTHKSGSTTGGSFAIDSNVNANDILIIAFETSDEAIGTPTTNGAATFTQIASVSNAAGAVRLVVFKSTPCDGSETTLTYADSGDHQHWWMGVIRPPGGVGTLTVPQVGSGATGATSSVSMPGFTTTSDNSLVIGIVAQNDIGTGAPSAFANADLASCTTGGAITSSAGNNGGLAVGYGVKATAGSVGAMTATAGTSQWAGVQIAIR